MSEPLDQPDGPVRGAFPATPRGWKQRSAANGRYDPTTTDIVFVVAIGLSLLLLLFGSFFLGFGLGTLCTDVPGNGTLDQAPCNRVTYGVKLNVALQVCVLIVAWLAGGRRRSHRWLAWMLLTCSLGGFVASFAIARSY